MSHYDNGQTGLNDWSAVRVTVGKRWVYGMIERELVLIRNTRNHIQTKLQSKTQF